MIIANFLLRIRFSRPCAHNVGFILISRVLELLAARIVIRPRSVWMIKFAHQNRLSARPPHRLLSLSVELILNAWRAELWAKLMQLRAREFRYGKIAENRTLDQVCRCTLISSSLRATVQTNLAWIAVFGQWSACKVWATVQKQSVKHSLYSYTHVNWVLLDVPLIAWL